MMLSTRIPEGRPVDGLHYGAHVTLIGCGGYYVRLDDGETWGVAILTPASDELVGDDAAIVASIREEMDVAAKASCRWSALDQIWRLGLRRVFRV